MEESEGYKYSCQLHNKEETHQQQTINLIVSKVFLDNLPISP